jgi:hypothetical protein
MKSKNKKRKVHILCDNKTHMFCGRSIVSKAPVFVGVTYTSKANCQVCVAKFKQFNKSEL